MIAVINKDGKRVTLTNSPKQARKLVEENVGYTMTIQNDY